jgi:uncharacterized protein YdaU (DUF1376 family)
MMAKADTWMPFYVADYARKTFHLTRDQHGGYFLLIMAAWAEGGRLPNDPAALAAITKATPAEWRKLSPVLLRFFRVDGDEIVHDRVVEEHERAQRLSDSRREAGAKGGRPRKQDESKTKPIGFAKDNQTGSQTETPSPSQVTPPNGGIPPNPPEGDFRDGAFSLAVQAYPEAGRLTVSLEAMGDAWDDEIAAGATPAAILAAAKAFAAGQYADGGGKVPRFDRWLRKGLWKLVAPVTPAVSPLAWHGPPDLLDALRAEMGASADAFLRLTRWDAGRHAIVTTSGTASDRLKREAGHVLRAAKVEIILEQAA